MNIYNVNLKANATITITEPSNFNTGILVLKGKIKINENELCEEKDFILFNNVDGDILVESVSEDTLFIVLSGEPINEPVVSHGPFVMNTVEEIYEAYEDFRNGKFGTEVF